MQRASRFADHWSAVASTLRRSVDLERTARDHKALQRRRGIRSAEELLRLALGYGPGGLSLRTAAAWAEMSGIASLSDVALLNRLRGAADWLCAIVDRLLTIDRAAFQHNQSRSIRLLDATSISKPGSSGTDWRLHVSYDLSTSSFNGFELTDVHGGETFDRFPLSANDIVIGDRAYARRTGLRSARDAGADFIVRAGWKSQRLLDSNRRVIDLAAALHHASLHGISDQLVIIDERTSDLPGIPARLIVLPKTAAQADRSRKRLARRNSKKGYAVPAAMTVASADYLILLTSLERETYPAEQVLSFYRLRWQVELAFKRLKSLLHIGRLPAKDRDLARSWLATHLIVALLIDARTRKVLDSSPSATGYAARAISLENPQDLARRFADGHLRCIQPRSSDAEQRCLRATSL